MPLTRLLEFAEGYESDGDRIPCPAPHELDLDSGCVMCHQNDFEKSGFGDRTILICDQCEREYHVGCMKDAGMPHLHVSSH